MLDILIVEDNKEIGGLLENFFRKENYVVSVQIPEKRLCCACFLLWTNVRKEIMLIQMRALVIAKR